MKYIAKIAEAVGWETLYRITAQAKTNYGHALITISMHVKPWIHADNIIDVEQHIAEKIDSKLKASDINLLMIHKL